MEMQMKPPVLWEVAGAISTMRIQSEFKETVGESCIIFQLLILSENVPFVRGLTTTLGILEHNSSLHWFIFLNYYRTLIFVHLYYMFTFQLS